MPSSPPGLKYIKELDAIRALAIISVLFNHWWPEGSFLNNLSIQISAPDIFFTLSGFLITKILLGDRKKADALHLSKVEVFKNFFMKRALRTMPAYYLAIVLTYFISGEPKAHFYPYLFFFTNFHQFYTETWGTMAHLWTMAVEQQFYFVWPWFILYIPKRFLLTTIIVLIGVGIASQHIIPLSDFSFLLPITCFDALGIGGLLAWLYENRRHKLQLYFKVLIGASMLAILISIAQNYWYFPLIIFTRTVVAIVTATIILHFIVNGQKQGKLSKAFFGNPFLLLMGRISYGIYLYHLFVYFYSYKLFEQLHKYFGFQISKVNTYALYMAVNFILLFVMAFLSWKYFEQPISELKKYFKTGVKKDNTQLAVNE